MQIIDYKELLRKYIKLVGSEEGSDFISYAEEPEFSKEEIQELNNLKGND